MLSRIASTISAHTSGLMPWLFAERFRGESGSNLAVPRWMPRRICRSVIVANLSSTCLSRGEEVGVKRA